MLKVCFNEVTYLLTYYLVYAYAYLLLSLAYAKSVF